MASKKRSVLFERNSATNNGGTSDPEPAARSGTYPLGAHGEPEKDEVKPSASALPLDAEALEALVTAHVLSRL